MTRRKARTRYQPQQPPTTALPAAATHFWGASIGTLQYSPPISGSNGWPSNIATNTTGTGYDNFVAGVAKGPSVVLVGNSFANSTNVIQPFAQIRTQCNRIITKGAIPLITWSPQRSAAGTNQSDYQTAKIAAGTFSFSSTPTTFDSYITQFAKDLGSWASNSLISGAAAASVPNSLGVPVPVFLRIGHEMNLHGTWCWEDGTNSNAAGDHKAMWQHVYTVVKTYAPYVTFLWCPNNVTQSGATSIANLYPGDAYVDWAGIDLYNQSTGGSWHTFADRIDVSGTTAYTTITGLTSKPIMLAEVGTIDNTTASPSKDNWIDLMLGTDIPSTYTQVKGFCWYNKNDYPGGSPATTVNLESYSQENPVTVFASRIAHTRWKAGSTDWLTSTGYSIIPSTP